MSDMLTIPTQIEQAERFTEDEFMLLAPEKPKTELIDGVMTMSAPATFAHDDLQTFLLTILRLYAESKHLGTAVGSNTPVVLSPNHLYVPDVLFIAEERRHIITPKEINGAPDLIIELLSASTAAYDRGFKRQMYEQAGLRELWLIDPYGPIGCRFYQRRDDHFIEIAALDQTIRSTAVPGFFLKLNWLWPEGGKGPISTLHALQELGVIS